MPFVRFSSEQSMQSSILLENIFIVEYMPFAPEGYTKIYLYGLSLACNEGNSDNSPERIAKMLCTEPSEVMAAYEYWANEGLVRLIPTSSYPIVEYLPVRRSIDKVKKFKPDKYLGFNKCLEALLPNRIILPNEYHEYYMLMENLHIEQEAVLEIVSYCVRRKGGEIGYPYILTVARNLANEGLRSYDAVHTRLIESEFCDPDILAIFKALGIKRTPDFEDYQLFRKWKDNFGFLPEDILYAAKKCKRTGGMPKLDSLLTRYHSNNAIAKGEMEVFDAQRDIMYGVARKINYYLGLSYQQVDYLVENYVTDWMTKGFEAEAVLKIAESQSKHTHRSWDNLNSELMRLYNLGAITMSTISKYFGEMDNVDKAISGVLAAGGIERAVTSRDRDNYRTWTYSWGFSQGMLLHAASLAKGKLSPLPYMNSILATWFESGVKTVDQAMQKTEAPEKKKIAEAEKRALKAADKEANYNIALSDKEFYEAETRLSSNVI